MATSYETVIGLEVHAQLLTASKLFCSSSTEFGSTPNSHISPVTLGLPGALPVLNRRAVEMAVRAALALSCTIHERSIFARKNYFYPDLPKGYQVSQYEEPFSTDGHLEFELEGAVRRVGIVRVHMEEDAGKNVHGVGGDSVVDLNRAGVPLIEIVGAPDLRSSGEAAAYMRALRDVLLYIGVNDGNLEEGSLRCDANVSLRPLGQVELGTRCELKNLNSFRFVQKAIDVEVARQTAILDAGGTIEQETRAFHPEFGTTSTLRSKEDAHDYRYFPEPDLPPLVIPPAMIEAQRALVGELPFARRQRWVSELGLTPAAALILSQHPAVARLFEDTLAAYPQPVQVANWIQTEVLRGARSHGTTMEFGVTSGQLAELLGLVEAGTISGKQAKEVFAVIEGTLRSPRAVVSELGLRVVADAGSLRPLCEELIAAHPKEAAAVRAGKRGILGFFVGQVMKRTNKSAEPKLVNDLFAELLGIGPE
ncbi:MAG: Asp-tRNA(Asn)/Glu-tRNA(Gln) amidotransferase subunit GatB [Polyangiaceae bacterium]|nr:Asp-tRNA(Asn)/Glu-tRNA(Gln) amidotransferase subunit GatB [Polyangiaceae bacterium]